MNEYSVPPNASLVETTARSLTKLAVHSSAMLAPLSYLLQLRHSRFISLFQSNQLEVVPKMKIDSANPVLEKASAKQK